MAKIPRKAYTLEFKQEAVRLVRSGQRVSEAARSLGVVEQTLSNWVKAHRTGKLWGSGGSAELTAEQMENLVKDEAHSYQYDGEGNLLTVDGGNTATYVYDGLNHRVSAGNAGGANEFMYDYAGRRVSSWIASINFGDEGRIYWDGQQIAYRSWSSPTYFDHPDWLSTERARTDPSGNVQAGYTSLAFGDGNTQTVSGTNVDQDHNSFTSLELDPETETYHAQYRQYSPGAGSWMSPDPYSGSYDINNPQSFNRYSYVLDNPLTLTDHSGLFTLPDPNPCGEVGPCGFDGPSGPGSPTGTPVNLFPPINLPANNGRASNRPGVLNCASGFAQRTSLAGGLNKFGIGSKGGTGGFLANALAGNAVSGLVNLFRGQGSMADVAFGGTRGGMPGGATGLNNGISGTLQDSVAVGANAAVNSGAEITTALGGTVSTAAFTGAEYATAVGWAKFGYDAASYATGLAGCATGIVH